MIFMDKDFDRGLVYGKHMLREISAAGANVSSGTLVDIGCGWGRVTYSLLETDFAGNYIGVDVTRNRIEFLEKAFAGHPRYRFRFLDVHNERYNKSRSKAQFNAMELVAAPATTILAMSVFTHMYEDDIRHYLQEFRKIVAPDGHAIFTAFILTPEAEAAADRGAGKFTMANRLNPHCRFERKREPLYAIAYDQKFLDGLITEAGFKPEYQLGTWSGAPGMRVQDWIIARPV
jgi:cyclopropane fatty-acyl-phospholipid synthase-like methyltransferase